MNTQEKIKEVEKGCGEEMENMSGEVAIFELEQMFIVNSIELIGRFLSKNWKTCKVDVMRFEKEQKKSEVKE